MERKAIKRLKSIIDLIALVTSILAFSPPFSSTALAEGGGLSFSVTCSIPAIAGLNAPLIQQEEVKTDTGQAEAYMPAGAKEQKPLILQEDRSKEVPLMEGISIPVMVKTLYSR